MIVIDSSIALSTVLPDEHSDEAMATLRHIKDNDVDALVPVHFTLEYTNGLLMALRRKRINQQEIHRLLYQWLDSPLETDGGADTEEIFMLADKHGLTMYDAAYLELAIRRKAKLATLDKTLMAAAKKEKVGFKG